MKLYKHQQKALDWCINAEKGCIYFDMGLGKTVIVCKLLNRINVLTLVIPPINAVPNWLKHLRELNPNKRIVDLNMGTKKNDEYLEKAVFNDNTIVVCANSQIKSIDILLKNRDFKCIIVDESHIMRNYSKTTRSIIRIGKTCQYKFLLTGTPTGNKYNLDYYFQLKLIDAIHINKAEFEERFVEVKSFFNYATRIRYKKYHGNKNEEELEEILDGCTIRMVKVNETVKNEVRLERYDGYDVFRKTKVLKGDDFIMYAINSSKKYYQLKLLSSGLAEDTDNGDIKIVQEDKVWWVKNKINELKNTRIVIWYNFNVEYEVLLKLCNSLGRPVSIYSGKTKDLALWRSKDDCIGLIQVKSGCQSINDLVTSNNVIYFSPPESLIDYNQSLKRTDRIGQTKVCNYWFLSRFKTLESLIWDKLFRSIPFEDVDFASHWEG